MTRKVTLEKEFMRRYQFVIEVDDGVNEDQLTESPTLNRMFEKCLQDIDSWSGHFVLDEQDKHLGKIQSCSLLDYTDDDWEEMEDGTDETKENVVAYIKNNV